MCPSHIQQLIIKLKCNDYVCEGTKLSVELVDERSLTHDADGHRFPLHDVGTGRPSRPRTPLESMNNIGVCATILYFRGFLILFFVVAVFVC